MRIVIFLICLPFSMIAMDQSSLNSEQPCTYLHLLPRDLLNELKLYSYKNAYLLSEAVNDFRALIAIGIQKDTKEEVAQLISLLHYNLTYQKVIKAAAMINTEGAKEFYREYAQSPEGLAEARQELYDAFVENDTSSVTFLCSTKDPRIVNSCQPDTTIPLIHKTILCYKPEMLKNFIAANADIETRDDSILGSYRNNTSLITAAMEGRADMVEMLLAAGANINAKNDFGTTALMKAADATHKDRDYTAAVQLLLKGGANTNPQDRHNRTALDRAKVSNHKQGKEIQALISGHQSGNFREPRMKINIWP